MRKMNRRKEQSERTRDKEYEKLEKGTKGEDGGRIREEKK